MNPKGFKRLKSVSPAETLPSKTEAVAVDMAEAVAADMAVVSARCILPHAHLAEYRHRCPSNPTAPSPCIVETVTSPPTR